MGFNCDLPPKALRLMLLPDSADPVDTDLGMDGTNRQRLFARLGPVSGPADASGKK